MSSKLMHAFVSVLFGVGYASMLTVPAFGGMNPILWLVLPAVALLGGLIPDLLEPASDALHRKFWHSKTVMWILGLSGLTLMLYASVTAMGNVLTVNKIPASLELYVIAVVATFLVSWALHLLIDSTTSMGLPAITGGRNPKRYADNKRDWGI